MQPAPGRANWLRGKRTKEDRTERNPAVQGTGHRHRALAKVNPWLGERLRNERSRDSENVGRIPPPLAVFSGPAFSNTRISRKPLVHSGGGCLHRSPATFAEVPNKGGGVGLPNTSCMPCSLHSTVTPETTSSTRVPSGRGSAGRSLAAAQGLAYAATSPGRTTSVIIDGVRFNRLGHPVDGLPQSKATSCLPMAHCPRPHGKELPGDRWFQKDILAALRAREAALSDAPDLAPNFIETALEADSDTRTVVRNPSFCRMPDWIPERFQWRPAQCAYASD